MTRGIDSLEEETFLDVQRTAGALVHGLAQILRPLGLTATQYHALRVLRSGSPSGLSCGEIAAQMTTRDSDVTRLLDRLEERGLVLRARMPRDRRVVRATVTMEGWRVLEGIDPEVQRLHSRQLGHLGTDRLRNLMTLLALARESAE